MHALSLTGEQSALRTVTSSRDQTTEIKTFGSIRLDSVRFSSIPFDSVRVGSIRFVLVQFGLIRFDSIWFDLIRLKIILRISYGIRFYTAILIKSHKLSNILAHQ